MADVFISYASEDRETAEMLANALTSAGWRVWWDRDNLAAGSDFQKDIGEALTKARCVIVLWSKSSVKSLWVRDEATEALKQETLVPVRIGNTPPPYGFRSIHTGNLLEWDGSNQDKDFQKLVRDIASCLGKPNPEHRKQVTTSAAEADPQDLHDQSKSVSSEEGLTIPGEAGSWAKPLLISVVVVSFLVIAVVGIQQLQKPAGAPEPTDPVIDTNIEIRMPETVLEHHAQALVEVSEAYNQLRKLDPNTPPDSEVVAGLAGKLSELIAFAEAGGNRELALSLLKKALSVMPDAEPLISLDQKLHSPPGKLALTEDERLKIAEFLENANSRLREDRFTLPEGANALDAYRRVLMIDPYNAEARKQLLSMANVFERLANKDIRQAAYRDAAKRIQIGLMISPSHEGLRSLRERLQPKFGTNFSP